MKMPYRELKNGSRIPSLGLGTFGSDKYSNLEIADAVVGAIEYGYRHVDCASIYGNEKEIGDSLKRVTVPREELWITSKVWNNRHDDAVGSCEDSLRDLKLDYLDLFLIHWPVPNHHAKGVTVNSRDPHAVPYIHDSYMKTWAQLESLVGRGLVKNIGTSNMTVPKLSLLMRDASIPPGANEMELHPHFQQGALFDYVVSQGIVPIGYSPFGSPSRPERDRTADDTVDLEDPIVLAIATKEGLTPAQVSVKWAIQRGQIPIPFSVKPSQYEASFDAACAPPLSSEDMAALSTIDRGCRLIKGQVFLWETAESWESLWDLDGVITA